MAKGYDSHLTLYENDGWFDTGTLNPIVPVIESEGLKVGLIKNERTSMVRNTRAQLEESIVNDFEYKPEGFIEIVPRLNTLPTIFMSHFQIVNEVDTGSSYLNTYVPLKYQPQQVGNDFYGTGVYGDRVEDVYSIDIKKNIVGDNNTGLNTQHYRRGICSKLGFSMQPNDDFKVKADYKFKSVDIIDSSSVFGDADIGSYAGGEITDWSNGTWSVSFDSGGTIFSEVSGMEIECDNNILEKKSVGALSRQIFSYGNYTVKGGFSLEYADDNWFSTRQDDPFSITGTIYHSGTEYLSIEMPRCFIKPFEKQMVKPDEFLDAGVNFEAYEYNGTSPITVTLNTITDLPSLDTILWDAAFGARTLSEYDFADAGSTSRTLSEYDFADRDV